MAKATTSIEYENPYNPLVNQQTEEIIFEPETELGYSESMDYEYISCLLLLGVFLILLIGFIRKLSKSI